MRTWRLAEEVEHSSLNNPEVVKRNDPGALHNGAAEAGVPERRRVGVLTVNEAEIRARELSRRDALGAFLDSLKLERSAPGTAPSSSTMRSVLLSSYAH